MAAQTHFKVVRWQSSDKRAAGRQQRDNRLMAGSPRFPKSSDDQPISDRHPPATPLPLCCHPTAIIQLLDMVR